ncbi:histidine kinase [Streptomyces sp. JV176]|uniref:sensor histidine kinase n=1 Tax=Streptomyces sp. JV176 TaxID=858630 RepID=UPI002E795BD8|nr:histidine kinase [Streptomyces sp. JV176]MEE1802916.1 histidine kinase [Streptomyces sp. JV176]
MTRLTGLWNLRHMSAKTNSAHVVEVYTRYTFYGLGGLEFGALSLNLTGREGPWPTLLLLVHSVLCCALTVQAMEWRLGRRARPVHLMLAVGGLSAAGIVGLLVLIETGAIPADGRFAALLMTLGGFGVASLALGLRTTEQRVYAVLGTPVATAVATLLLGMGWRQAGLNFIGVLAMVSVLTSAFVFSIWLVRVVWELDAANGLRTRLAVAEERLRFGRDMHDVMGRNLAVIALKSELAVQLAERGRPEAMTQMTEVQRIARESQREVRDVVRGYREANLHTELEGARSVLEAAGIDCRIDGIETIEGDMLNGARSGRGGRGGGQGKGGGLPTGVQSALGWVVREATTNVLRHGDPRRCTVRLLEQPLERTSERTSELTSKKGGSGGWEAVLIVENDGVPEPDPAEGGAEADGSAGQRSKGSGLAGLRERLAAVDGTLEAGPTGSGGGFRLTARVPLPKERPGPRPTTPAGADTGAGTGTEVAA